MISVELMSELMAKIHRDVVTAKLAGRTLEQHARHEYQSSQHVSDDVRILAFGLTLMLWFDDESIRRIT